MSIATPVDNRMDLTGSTKKRLNAALWIVQILLAALFLLAGSTKLVLPIDVLTSMGSPNQIALPGWFIRFIGVSEVLGAIGLIPMAGAGLAIIMIGATSITLAANGLAPAVFPLIVGLLASFVAYARSS